MANQHGRSLKLYLEPGIASFLPLSDILLSTSRSMVELPISSEDPWSTYMQEVYSSRRAPQPLGTVVFEEIEEKARQKLKDHPSVLQWLSKGSKLVSLISRSRRLPVRLWKRRYQFNPSCKSTCLSEVWDYSSYASERDPSQP